MDLGEICCFQASQSVVIRENLAMVKEKEEGRHRSDNWY